MDNKERLQINNNNLRECLEIANNLPDNSSGGTLIQQQVDYRQNDETKIDFIKNRPCYASDEHKYEMVWKDENIDYSNYKVGDIIPRKDGLNELIVRMNWINVFDEERRITDQNAVDVGLGEDSKVTGVFVDNNSLVEVHFIYSDVADDDGTIIPAGIYIKNFFDSLNDALVDPSACTVEFIYTFYKQVDIKYITDAPLTVVIDVPDFSDIPELIPVTSTDDLINLALSMFSLSEVRVVARAKISEILSVCLPVRSLGLGLFEVTLLNNTHIYSLDLNDSGFQYVGSRPLLPETVQEQTATYGLRKSSLTDAINDSLAERGLTLERLQEIFPKPDFTKYLLND